MASSNPGWAARDRAAGPWASSCTRTRSRRSRRRLLRFPCGSSGLIFPASSLSQTLGALFGTDAASTPGCSFVPDRSFRSGCSFKMPDFETGSVALFDLASFRLGQSPAHRPYESSPCPGRESVRVTDKSTNRTPSGRFSPRSVPAPFFSICFRVASGGRRARGPKSSAGAAARHWSEASALRS